MQTTANSRWPIFWQWSKGKTVRDEHWRLVSDNNGPWELYDMRNDKTETKDLTNEFPEIARKLEAMYNNWIKSFAKQ